MNKAQEFVENVKKYPNMNHCIVFRDYRQDGNLYVDIFWSAKTRHVRITFGNWHPKKKWSSAHATHTKTYLESIAGSYMNSVKTGAVFSTSIIIKEHIHQIIDKIVNHDELNCVSVCF